MALLAGQAQADTTLQLTEVITSPQRTELLKGMIAKFEAANPGVKVEVTSLPWGQAFEKLATMVQGGQIPDVVEMPDRWLSLYANNGQLESLKPWMDQWPETKELTDRTIEFGSVVKDTPYMIPYGFYIRAMFWNKKLFKQAGHGRAARRPWPTSWRRRRRSRPWAAARPATACAAAPAPPTAT